MSRSSTSARRTSARTRNRYFCAIRDNAILALEVQEILGHVSILSTQVYMKLPIQKGRRAAAAIPAMRVFPEAAVRKLPIKKR